MNQFINLNQEELEFIDGGVDGNYLFAGAVFAAVGVGCLAAATGIGAPVGAALVAYAGSWGLAGGVTCGTIGLVK
ncbi:hypothetical protein [Cellulosilyticum ruminicola]|uniref:hypothetical protein n=1 Tax=Cellulosilyticum ruminicola TaxID=425254 RepID=UPI0006CF9F28|nr:hypothetical protein [Cellulosilyticum ruminicola]